MPEPNATVDPFDSAGIRLPTQGKGYSGTDSATDVAVAAAFGAPVPVDNAAPGPAKKFIAVDIPFAAEGDVFELRYMMGIRADNTNVTPATTFSTLVGVIDSGVAGFFIQSSSDSSPNATIALTDFVDLKCDTTFTIPVGVPLVYPLTVFLVYFSDGDALIGQNQVVGVNPPPCSFMVQRVPVERTLSMPPQELI
jgi:hypothetical protein